MLVVRRSKPVLVQVFFSRPLQIVESSLPEDARLRKYGNVLVCDFNHTLAELAHEAAKYHDCTGCGATKSS